ncbi:MAG: hypothetical protein WDN10_05365 [bacterium]
MTPEDRRLGRVAFAESHPELKPDMGILIATVMCCDEFPRDILETALEEAYGHIFGMQGPEGCESCKERFRLQREERDRLAK